MHYCILQLLNLVNSKSKLAFGFEKEEQRSGAGFAFERKLRMQSLRSTPRARARFEPRWEAKFRSKGDFA